MARRHYINQRRSYNKCRIQIKRDTIKINAIIVDSVVLFLLNRKLTSMYIFVSIRNTFFFYVIGNAHGR